VGSASVFIVLPLPCRREQERCREIHDSSRARFAPGRPCASLREVGVVDLRREAQVGGIRIGAGQERRSEVRPVEVVAARLVAARIARIDQHVRVGLVGQHRGPRELALVEVVAQVEAVELGARVADAGQGDDAGGGRGKRRVGKERRQRRLLRRAEGVVVVEVAFEALALLRVARAEREAELVGDVDDVVREDREILAFLPVLRAHVADVVGLAEPIECGEEDRGRRAERRGGAGDEAGHDRPAGRR
jgi:hypothetical protein